MLHAEFHMFFLKIYYLEIFKKLSTLDITADNFNKSKKLFTVQCCLAANIHHLPLCPPVWENPHSSSACYVSLHLSENLLGIAFFFCSTTAYQLLYIHYLVKPILENKMLSLFLSAPIFLFS